MDGTGKGRTLAFFLMFLIPPLHGAADSPAVMGSFPLIVRLDNRDTGFKQFTEDVENNRRRIYSRERGQSPQVLAENLTIYQYTPRDGEDLYFLAARCNIPYSALASLNRLSHPLLLETGKPLLLPSCPGIFIPEEPVTDLEHLLAAARLPQREGEAAALTVTRNALERGTVFRFFPGADFDPTERIFFLNTGFSFPLRSFTLTSAFGVRQNPVTGNIRFHEGLDLAAPEGTPVYAAGEGIVAEIGEDAIYGIYIIIQHGEHWASLYGHLRKVETILRSSVKSGTLIGRVGSTGQSTGPHLHFELRQNGKARDPDKFLFLPGRR
jgi:murein DD-endopeptidase MepM/ murein hydrolase activator NlpD